MPSFNNCMKLLSLRKSVFLTFIGIFLFSSAQAWWGAGHMVVGMIAYQRLEPNAKAQVDSLIEVLEVQYPYTNHFVAAATWPDDLKAEGVHYYDTWHYTSHHYNPDKVNLPEPQELDVVWAINQSQKILKSRRSRPMEKARALGFLIHFVGDIHQPLHAGSMFSNDLPGGDMGGNRYRILDDHGSLHKLWDDGCGYTSELNNIDPYGVPKEPLNKKELKRLEDFAADLVKAFPESEMKSVGIHDPEFWAMESSKLAQKFAYDGFNGEKEGRKQWLKPGGEPSEAYLTKGQEIVKQQLALAGYRLARMLNYIYKG